MNIIKNEMMKAVFISIIGKEISMKNILYYARDWIIYGSRKEVGSHSVI